MSALFEVAVDIPANSTKANVTAHSNHYGYIKKIKLILPKNIHNKKIRAYIHFYDSNSCSNALHLNSSLFLGNIITVQMLQPKQYQSHHTFQQPPHPFRQPPHPFRQPSHVTYQISQPQIKPTKSNASKTPPSLSEILLNASETYIKYKSIRNTSQTSINSSEMLLNTLESIKDDENENNININDKDKNKKENIANEKNELQSYNYSNLKN